MNREVFEGIENIYKTVADEYSTYIRLGRVYEEDNVNQAYLCYEHAWFLCDNEDMKLGIVPDMERCRRSPEFRVRPTSFVILSYNCKDIMIGCIESIREFCAPGSYEIVVVDNASTDGITDWLKEQKDIKLAINEKNSGFAAGCNQGAKMSEPDYDIMLLNNDTKITKHSMLFLRLGLYESREMGSVGPVTSYAINEQREDQANHTTEEWIEIAKGVNRPSVSSMEYKSWLVGFALLINREAWDVVGGLDVRFPYGYFEDTDFGFRLMEGGYRSAICHNSFIFHYGSVSMSANLEETMKKFHENEERLVKKWKFDVNKMVNVDHELISYIKKDKWDEFSVLVIGCGLGANMGRIQYRYPNARVAGIEAEERISRIGQGVGEIYNCPLESGFSLFDDNTFDYIIVGNILGVFADPKKVLGDYRRLLKADGKVVFLQKNPLFAPYIMELFDGKCATREKIKDDGKLYTKEELLSIISSSGLRPLFILSIANNPKYSDKEEAAIEFVMKLGEIYNRDDLNACAFLIEAGK